MTNFMTKHILPVALVSLLTLLALLFFCETQLLAQDTDTGTPAKDADRVMSADEREINAVLQEIFWRVKANDNSALYDNEFAYLRKKITLDEYLKGVRFRRTRKPNSDSIIVLTLDSAKVTGDTAVAYLTLTAQGDSAAHFIKSQQYLFREDGRWIKPISTNFRDNNDFYRRIRQYEEDAKHESGG